MEQHSNRGDSDSYEELFHQLCAHCRGILERVEAIEKKSYTSVEDFNADEDRQRCLEKQDYFETVEEFKTSEYYQKYMMDDDSLDHKSSRTELLDSARAGCFMCHWLSNSLESRQAGSSGCPLVIPDFCNMDYSRRSAAMPIRGTQRTTGCMFEELPWSEWRESHGDSIVEER